MRMLLGATPSCIHNEGPISGGEASRGSSLGDDQMLGFFADVAVVNSLQFLEIEPWGETKGKSYLRPNSGLGKKQLCK
jgi:hypothetical protein